MWILGCYCLCSNCAFFCMSNGQSRSDIIIICIETHIHLLFISKIASLFCIGSSMKIFIDKTSWETTSSSIEGKACRHISHAILFCQRNPVREYRIHIKRKHPIFPQICHPLNDYWEFLLLKIHNRSHLWLISIREAINHHSSIPEGGLISKVK